MKAEFEFQIKRGVVNSDDLENDEPGVLQQCLELCKGKKHKEAVALLLPATSFEWDWSNGDGDPEEFMVDPEPISFDCSNANTTMSVAEDDGQLIVTATVKFAAEVKEDTDADELKQWLEDNSAYSCGYISGGWGYDGSDGDNVWLVKLDGKDV